MRHITDKTRPVTPQRTERFARIERRALPQPVGANGLRGAEAPPPPRRLQTYLARDAAEAAPTRRHVADTPGAAADRAAPYLRIDRNAGLGPALAALHARSGDPATVARTRAHLRQARAEAPVAGRHIADGPHGAAPARVARYVDFARAEGLHPSVRALRTRRGDATALIRLREFLRIARGERA